MARLDTTINAQVSLSSRTRQAALALVPRDHGSTVDSVTTDGSDLVIRHSKTTTKELRIHADGTLTEGEV